MHDTGLQEGLDPDRLRFINAGHLICGAIRAFQMVAREQQPQLYRRLLQDIARYRMPAGDKRSHPRVVKRKMSNVHLKRLEHRQWRQPSMTFRATVAILN